MRAIDTDTGRILTDEEAIMAADNPLIYKWVRFENEETEL